MWDLSCPDWEERIRTGRSLIPDLPLIRSEADMGLAFFDELKLPDVPGKPRLGEAAGQWFRDIVATSFGSWDPVSQQNFIRDVFVLAPKGSSKTSYGAGLALAVMLMNRRPRAEALFIGPTQAISDRAYEQAVGMIEESPDLKRRFRPRDHLKTIEDLVNRSEMKVKTFDLNILTGAILIFAHLDEIHLLGKSSYAGKVIRQIRGGIDKTPEGKFLITTTESDDIPAGAFKDELHSARKHRDGEFRGKEARPTLSVMFEFPQDIAKDPDKWRDPANWPMVQPNLGRSVHLKDLVQGWNSDKEKGERSIREWASQYLNIEMGVGHKTDGWPGAEFWAGAEEPELDLDSLIERSEAIVVGIDGGGLDDLFGASALGREQGSKTWLSVSKAWCHKSVLERRKTIAARLLDFSNVGEIEIIDDEFVDVAGLVPLLEPCDALLLPKDVAGVLILVSRVLEAGKLAAVAIDVEGPYGELADALALIGVTQENKNLVGVGQGYRLMNAIKTSERKLANGTLKHGSSQLMDWCVGNIKIEPTATAIRATKQNAGDAKIDPAMALFDAVSVMVTNPEPVLVAGKSFWDDVEFDEDEAADDVASEAA